MRLRADARPRSGAPLSRFRRLRRGLVDPRTQAHNESRSAQIALIRRGAFEAGALTVLAIGASYWLAPADAFGVRSQFPWLWLVPALLALRYGTFAAVITVSLILAAWFVPILQPVASEVDDRFPQQYFLGGLILALLCGQFADVWNDRLNRIRVVNAHLDERLRAVTRNHYLLRLSHDRLEQELLTRPVTLRDLLEDMKRDSDSPEGELPGADALLRLLVQSCEVESAAIYRMSGDRIDDHPVAMIGQVDALKPDDALIVRALEDEAVAHIKWGESLESSNYLVAAPITTSGKRRIALLVIERMPLFALNAETIDLIAVLIGYFADGHDSQQAMRPVLMLRPDCPPELALELVRLQRLHLFAGVQSALVAFKFKRDEFSQSLLDFTRRSKRALDLVWELETPTAQLLVMLLPLANQATIEGYLMRMESSIKQQFDIDMARGGIGVHVSPLSAAEPEWILDDLLNRCGVVTTGTPEFIV